MPDVARFFGIFLVYYGHIVERIMYLKDPAATMQYKLIYSFHMVFFFLLAGYVFNQDKVRLPLRRFLARQGASRVLPYVAFSLLLVGLSLIVPGGHFVLVDTGSVAGYMHGAAATALGMPVFNIPLWFLASLLSVELLHYLVGRFLKTDLHILLAALCFYVGGYYLTVDYMFLPGPSYWLVHEAPAMYAFYLVGLWLRRNRVLSGTPSRGGLALGVLLTACAVWFTFDLNQGPFKIFQAVVVLLSGHGHVFWFVFTGLCGSLMVMLLASFAGDNRFMRFMGENTIIIFCLNGVFYHFLNGPFAAWFMDTFTATPWSVTLACLLFTLVSLAACIPFIFLFNRYLPQLVGRPYVHGPLLPALVRR